METQLKPQDLRTGNLIKDGHDIETISVRHLQMMVEGQAEFDPIPLTEEWLLKMGFEIRYFNNNKKMPLWWKVEGNRHIDIYINKGGGYYFMINSLQMSIVYEYLHQLQNLFYALTGQELTIKPI